MSLLEACKTGDIHHLQQLKKANNLGDISAHDEAALRAAIRHGHLDVIKWLASESGQLLNITANSNFAMKWAAYKGRLDILKWIVSELNDAIKAASKVHGFQFSNFMLMRQRMTI